MGEDKRIEITFRLPMDKGADFMKLLRSGGEADIIVRDSAAGKPDRPGTAVLSARAEYRLPDIHPAMGATVEAGELHINPGRHEVSHRGALVPSLTFTEFGILLFLARRAGWVFSREQIVEGVKGKDYPVTNRAIDVQVAGLRKKLGAAASYVQTVRGVGYRFCDRP